jgi:hypothetical protein
MKFPKVQTIFTEDCEITLTPVPAPPMELLAYFLPGVDCFDTLNTADRDVADSLLCVVCAFARAARGDAWACAHVNMKVTWRGFNVSVDSSAVVSHDNEIRFTLEDPVYEQLLDAALDKLQDAVDQAYADIQTLGPARA